MIRTVAAHCSTSTLACMQHDSNTVCCLMLAMPTVMRLSGCCNSCILVASCQRACPQSPQLCAQLLQSDSLSRQHLCGTNESGATLASRSWAPQVSSLLDIPHPTNMLACTLLQLGTDPDQHECVHRWWSFQMWRGHGSSAMMKSGCPYCRKRISS